MNNNVSAIFEGLNDEQRKAVECVEGPVLIVAGAGSGKTRVLTSRVANILERGCAADKVLALTFTKKAAEEMKERIALMVGAGRARRLYMGTFHSIFIRILRQYAASLGYPESFTVYDTSDSLSAIKTCIKELGLDDKVYKPKEVLSRISMAKNNLVTDTGYRSNPNILQSDISSRKPRICDIYSLYVRKCKQAGVMDFDDIILNMNILLRDNKPALEEIAARFEYILVDEYQDTNIAQYMVLKKLAQFRHNICVVGDDSQSIYAFRGAKIENILNFKKDYPECRTFRLERNYRSTRNIVGAANSLIARNEGRIPKECYSEGPEGEKIRLVRAYTEQEESILIASSIIERIQEEKSEYKDFAILYRTNAQSRALEEALRRRNMPYMIYSGNSFFERAEVKDMMAYFKLVVNPDDDEAFRRSVNKPARGIGDTSIEALSELARANSTSLYRAASLQDFEVYGLRNAAMQKIRAFCRMISELSSALMTTDAHELALKTADVSGLYAFYKSDTSIEGLSRSANIEELLNSVAQFIEENEAEAQEEGRPAALATLGDFLENISLLSAVDVSEDEENNKITLMTVHSAKGLEFPYVYVTGMEENLFPSGGTLTSRSEVEEERRLFYVAITRAEKAVTLSYADTRMRNGRHESNSPSRFIREIDPKYILNPLRDDDFGADDDDEDDAPFAFRRNAFSGRRSVSSTSPESYGRSSSVTYFKKPARGARPMEMRPSETSSSTAYHGKASVINRPLPEKIPDSEFIPTPMTELRTGMRVEHNRFGAGTILDISGSVPELKAKIVFDSYGEKMIMLKYAKLRKI